MTSAPFGPGVAYAPSARPPSSPEDRPEGLAELFDGCPAALSDGEALELLIGGVRAEGVVTALLGEFGSLPEVLAATPAELARVAPPRVVRCLGLVRDLARRMLAAPLRARPLLASSPAVDTYLRAVMTGLGREQFRVLFLDRKNQLIADEVMGEGTVDHAPVYPREVMRRALERNASALILAHNHPSGDPTASEADVEMTREVVAAGRALRIAVHDHVIVGGQATLSLRAAGRM